MRVKRGFVMRGGIKQNLKKDRIYLREGRVKTAREKREIE